MAATKCPSCGAGILEGSGKFCSFCGALLPDDIHRAELKIENVSDMARLEFEREQARKQEEKEKKAKKAKIIRSMSSVVVPGIMLFVGWVFSKLDGTLNRLSGTIMMIGGAFMFLGVLSLLLTLIFGPNDNKNNTNNQNSGRNGW